VLLGGLLLVHGSAAGRRLRLGQVLVLGRAVEALLEDRLRLVDLKLGPEAGGVGSEAAAVRTAPSVGEVEALVDDLVTYVAPVTLSTAVLLGLLGVFSSMAALGKVARQMLRGSCRAIGETGMVLVVELVRASHL